MSRKYDRPSQHSPRFAAQRQATNLEASLSEIHVLLPHTPGARHYTEDTAR